jgi:hypothetical protein
MGIGMSALLILATCRKSPGGPWRPMTPLLLSGLRVPHGNNARLASFWSLQILRPAGMEDYSFGIGLDCWWRTNEWISFTYLGKWAWHDTGVSPVSQVRPMWMTGWLISPERKKGVNPRLLVVALVLRVRVRACACISLHINILVKNFSS